MEISVIKSGMLTTVQDIGRRGFRDVGVPLGGAVDPFALRLANLLVGNRENSACLECTLVGPELSFHQDGLVALMGAEFNGMLSGQPHVVRAGERLVLGTTRSGCRGYLAVAGGILVDKVLGGAGTFLRGGFGGKEGRALRDGDTLNVGEPTRRMSGNWRIDSRILPAYSGSPTVRVVAGPQAGEFGEAFYGADFTVTAKSDRMGVRLAGQVIARRGEGELPSSTVLPGTIQVPPDGNPIVLLADAQTIGGYPQVAHVIAVDLPLIAQLRPGDSVRFCATTLAEAHAAARARERAVGILREGLAQKFS